MRDTREDQFPEACGAVAERMSSAVESSPRASRTVSPPKEGLATTDNIPKGSNDNPASAELIDEPQYEEGYDAVRGRAWRKIIKGPKLRGPLEWSEAPQPDPAKGSLDPIECKFKDGHVVVVPHVTQEPWSAEAPFDCSPRM